VGRKGALAEISKGMGKLSPEERKRIGMLLNDAKQRIEAALDAKNGSSMPTPCAPASMPSGWISPCPRPPQPRPPAPITRIQRELEDLFISLGFAVLDGPEVETE